MNEEQIREGLRKHWVWLRLKDDYKEVADFVIAHGRRSKLPLEKSYQIKGARLK